MFEQKPRQKTRRVAQLSWQENQMETESRVPVMELSLVNVDHVKIVRLQAP